MGPSQACITHLTAECAVNGTLEGWDICTALGPFAYVAMDMSTMLPLPAAQSAFEMSDYTAKHGQYLMTLGTMCNEPIAFPSSDGSNVFEPAVVRRIFSGHPEKWTTKETAGFFFFYGELYMSLPLLTNPRIAHLVFQHDLDGKGFIHSTAKDYQAIGFTVGISLTFVRTRDKWLSSYSFPPSDFLDMSSNRVSVEKFNVSATFMLEKLHAINVEDFTFEAELMLIVAWEDGKIFHACDSAGVGGYDEDSDDPCRFFWQPTLVWPNVVIGDTSEEDNLAPLMIEDFGFNSRVGKFAKEYDANYGTTYLSERDATLNPSLVLNTSTALRFYRVRGTFSADFAFHAFPFDKQQLNISVQLPFDLPMSKASLVARAEPQVVFPSTTGSDLPLWNVNCVTVAPTVKDMNTIGSVWMAAPDDPWAEYTRRAMNLPPMDMMAEFTSSGQTISQDSQRWSGVTITIHVTRIPFFYFVNYVVIIVLLVIVSFFSLLLSANSLDARLGITLTCVLGLNVFQIIIIDSMPETGYLTHLHALCFVSTAVVILLGFENVVVYAADMRNARLQAVIMKMALFKKESNTKEGNESTLKLQRAWRKKKAKAWQEKQVLDHSGISTPREGNAVQTFKPRSTAIAPVQVAPSGAPEAAAAKLRQQKKRKPKSMSMYGCLRSVSSSLLDRFSIWAANWLDYVSFFVFAGGFCVAWGVLYVYREPPNGPADFVCPEAPPMITGFERR